MVAVKYKYKNEPDKIVKDTNNYKIVPGVVPGTATEWQLLMKGTIVNKHGDGIDHPYLYTCRPCKTPDLVLTERLHYATAMTGNLIEGVSFAGGVKVVGAYWFVTGNGTTEMIRSSMPYDHYLSDLQKNPFYPQPGGGAIQARRLGDEGQHYSNISLGLSWGMFYTPNRKYRNIDMKALKVHPTNGTPNYTLEIFKDDSQKFNRTELYAPEYVKVIQDGEECPEGTCPVQCGNHVCCYGSNGIAVSSYQY
jgi:hypothetical protein